MRNVLMCVLMFLIAAVFENVRGQVAADSVRFSYIRPYHVLITSNKTTNIVFPAAIKTVDRGSADVLIQKAKNVQNVLQVKAAGESMKETTLSVITEDGHLYCFVVNYVKKPDYSGIVIEHDTTQDSTALVSLSEEDVSLTRLKFLCRKVSVQNNNVNVKTGQYRVFLKLKGIYVHESLLFFKVVIRNISDINYDIELFRMFIRDKKNSKRTAIQDVDITPLLIEGDISRIPGRRKQTLVFAVRKFTIPDKKYLALEMMEQNGGRHLLLKVPGKKLIDAAPLLQSAK